MRQSALARSVLPAMLVAAGVAATAAIVWAGELTPYSLPSQQRAMPDTRQQAARPPAAENPYYKKFASDAASLTPAQRTELEKSFSLSRDRALMAGRIEEAQHYARLVAILKATR